MSRVGLAVCATMTLLALGGCERGTPEKGRTSIEVPEGDYQPRLLAMPDAQRNAVFFRAVHDAGCHQRRGCANYCCLRRKHH